ncbi:MAG: hypothetical protein ACJAZT_001826 [Gammaproteobacteria bacterium]|jgi:hypothetical protein
MPTGPTEYKSASYATPALEQRMSVWTSHSEYLVLGKIWKVRREIYRYQFESELGEGLLDQIRMAVSTRFVFNNGSFRRQVEELSGIPQTF